MTPENKPNPMFQIVSDLHSERYGRYFDVNPFDMFDKVDNVENIILAGDIGEPLSLEPFLKKVCDQYENVIMVAGNHEFYHTSVEEAFSDLKSIDNNISNFHFLNNESICIDGINIFGTTLWSRPEAKYYDLIERSIADFRVIKNWNINKHSCYFDEALDALINSSEKDIVISHFVPSSRSIPVEFKDSTDINAYFHSNLESYMDDVKVWVHGHTHHGFDYYSNDTRIICNPYGYTRLENPIYSKGKIFSVDKTSQ